MRLLLIATAVLEAGVGLALLVSPAMPIALLLGTELDSAAALTVARVAGAALLALGVACGLARNDFGSPATRAIVTAMLLYNLAAVVVLGHAGIGLKMFGVALWPGVILHAGLAAWCVGCLRK